MKRKLPACFMIYVLLPTLLTLVIAVVIIRQSISSKGKTYPLSYAAGFPGTEKILVPPTRVKMAASAVAVLGLIFLSLAIPSLGLASWREGFFYFSMAMLLAGIYFVYAGIKLYQRNNSIVQVELDNNGISYKPEKWYSFSRTGGGVNVTSVFFYRGMITTPWKEINHIRFVKNQWTGSYIRFFLNTGKEVPLIVIAENDVQLEEIYHQVRKKLEQSR